MKDNINSPSPETPTPVTIDFFAIDSSRHVDSNGFLHVTQSPLTKETVNPYYGREVPDWQHLGLDPEKIYHGYRSGKELEKAVSTFNGIPLLLAHKVDSAESPLKEERIGSVGTNAQWVTPYIMNALTVTDIEAIKLIQRGVQKELSACYRYTPVMEKGSFNGVGYDFIMTNIEANHVAVVAEGRAGKDVYVFDSLGEASHTSRYIFDNNTILKETKMPKVEQLKEAFTLFSKAFEGFLTEEAGEKAHAADEEEKQEEKKPACDTEAQEEQKAFGEGVKYGESKEKAEPKKLDSEHESEGAKRAMDSAIQQARLETREELKTIYAAADEVRPTVAIKNPFAYDSANLIYQKALDVEGVSYKDVHPSAYRSLYLAVKGNKTSASVPTMAADIKVAETSFSKNVKIED